jgi:hypothetical protein
MSPERFVKGESERTDKDNRQRNSIPWRENYELCTAKRVIFAA